MARRPRKSTPQEEMVATFIKHSISSRSIFHPDQWSSGTEPADMICVVGRAMLLVNMTAGGSYLNSLAKHNIDQARSRIEEWKGGRQIRGKNDQRSFAVDWSDIDYIAVISVVDGRHAACLDHSLAGLDMDGKVTLCTTLTTRVFRELATKGGGARDLVDICRLLAGKGTTTQFSTLRLLRKRYNDLIHSFTYGLPDPPSRLGQAIIGGRPVNMFEEARFTLEAARREPIDGLGRFSDLSWRDVFEASAFTVACRAEMEGRLEGQIRAQVFGTATKFQVVVSTNMEALTKTIPQLIEVADQAGCSFTQLISLTSIGASISFAILESNDDWGLEISLSNQ
jgi:hypothetical protein